MSAKTDAAFSLKVPPIQASAHTVAALALPIKISAKHQKQMLSCRLSQLELQLLSDCLKKMHENRSCTVNDLKEIFMRMVSITISSVVKCFVNNTLDKGF